MYQTQRETNTTINTNNVPCCQIIIIKKNATLDKLRKKITNCCNYSRNKIQKSLNIKWTFKKKIYSHLALSTEKKKTVILQGKQNFRLIFNLVHRLICLYERQINDIFPWSTWRISPHGDTNFIFEFC